MAREPSSGLGVATSQKMAAPFSRAFPNQLCFFVAALAAAALIARRLSRRRATTSARKHQRRASEVTIFISGLPESAPSAGFKAAIKAALEPFDATRIKLGCSEHGRLSGYAWATLPDADAARRARDALDGTLVLDFAPAARGRATPPPRVVTAPLQVAEATGKRDMLFPRLSREARLRLRLDKVALYSVVDQPSAERVARLLAALCAVGSARPARVTDAFACVGGSAIALAREFDEVVAIELDAGRADMISHNAAVALAAPEAARVRVVRGDCAALLGGMGGGGGGIGGGGAVAPVVHMDPPWGGTSYDATAGDLALEPDDAVNRPDDRAESPAPTLRALVLALARGGACRVLAARLPARFDVDAMAAELVAPGAVPSACGDARERPLPFVLKLGPKARLFVACFRPPRGAAAEAGPTFGLANLDALVAALVACDKSCARELEPKFYDFDAARWIRLRDWKGCGDARGRLPKGK